jgi:hypothetical protein
MMNADFLMQQLESHPLTTTSSIPTTKCDAP